jgi:hypothetical protein
MSSTFKSLIGGMDADQLSDLAETIAAERNSRNAVTLESIHPGMKPADLARASAEITRLLKEGGR